MCRICLGCRPEQSDKNRQISCDALTDSPTCQQLELFDLRLQSVRKQQNQLRIPCSFVKYRLWSDQYYASLASWYHTARLTKQFPMFWSCTVATTTCRPDTRTSRCGTGWNQDNWYSCSGLGDVPFAGFWGLKLARIAGPPYFRNTKREPS